MSHYQFAWKAATKEIVVQAKGDALPAGFTKLVADVEHVNLASQEDHEGSGDSHVIWHHIRDEMYKLGIFDMASVKITIDSVYVAVTGISSLPATVNLANGATQQITNTISPVGASNTGVTYSTTNAAIASVSASGLITAGATDGVATITVTTADGAFTDTVVVTVA